MNIPEGYQTIMPYLIVKGADKFSRFTQKVFGATERMRHMRDEDYIMHAEVVIGGSTRVRRNNDDHGFAAGYQIILSFGENLLPLISRMITNVE